MLLAHLQTALRRPPLCEPLRYFVSCLHELMYPCHGNTNGKDRVGRQGLHAIKP